MISLLNWSPSTPTRAFLSITDYHLVWHQPQVCFRDAWESLFQGCQGFSVYLDDILLIGPTAESHFARF